LSDDLTIPNPGYRGSRAGRYGTGNNQARQGMDPDTRRLVMFAGGLGALLASLIGASAIISHRSSSDIPVIAADPKPIRVKPDNPGGMKIDGAENDVFTAGADTADAKLAPAAENPDRQALRTGAPSPPQAAAPQPAPKQAAKTAVTNAAAKPVSLTQPPASALAAARPGPTLPAPTPTETKADAAARPQTVQLAALPTEDAAKAEWQQLAKRMPDLLNGRQPNYSRTEHDGHVFWRVRTGGFADPAQARQFCDRIRAKGTGCSVTDP
jgi:hypothetical protein